MCGPNIFFDLLHSRLPRLNYVGISLRTGTIIIGMIYIFFGLCAVLVTGVAISEKLCHEGKPGVHHNSLRGVSYILLTFSFLASVIGVILPIMMLVGVFMSRPKYMQTFIDFLILSMIASPAFILLNIWDAFPIIPTSQKDKPNMVFMNIFAIPFFVYTTLIVNSYHNKLVEYTKVLRTETDQAEELRKQNIV